MIEVDGKPALYTTGWVGETWSVQAYRDILATFGIAWKTFTVYLVFKVDGMYRRRSFCGGVS